VNFFCDTQEESNSVAPKQPRMIFFMGWKNIISISNLSFILFI
jgi:hypothetical protein